MEFHLVLPMLIKPKSVRAFVLDLPLPRGGYLAWVFLPLTTVAILLSLVEPSRPPAAHHVVIVNVFIFTIIQCIALFALYLVHCLVWLMPFELWLDPHGITIKSMNTHWKPCRLNFDETSTIDILAYSYIENLVITINNKVYYFTVPRQYLMQLVNSFEIAKGIKTVRLPICGIARLPSESRNTFSFRFQKLSARVAISLFVPFCSVSVRDL